MPLSREERLLKKQQHAERRMKRKAKKASKGSCNPDDINEIAIDFSDLAVTEKSISSEEILRNNKISLEHVSDDFLVSMMCYLNARDLASLISTCTSINRVLREGRIQHLLSMLGDQYLLNESDIRLLLEQSQLNAPLNRLRSKKVKKNVLGADDYPSYARFIEEAVCGRATQCFGRGKGNKQPLPLHAEGRVCSTSPEHSVCRAGGNGQKGAGGSGVYTWGVGRRGQLGNGKREVELFCFHFFFCSVM